MKTLAIALMVVMGILVCPAGADTPAPLAPKIVCDEMVYDFGERQNTEIVEHLYPIRNEGTLSLEITDVRASCGCTAATPSEKIIPPGGTADIQVRFDLRGRSGQQMKTITINSNDPETPRLVLQIRGVAQQNLRAEPSNIFFGRMGTASTRTRPVTILAYETPVRILSWQSDSPYIQVTGIDEEASAKQHALVIQLSDEIPHGNFNATVFIKTDLPGSGELRLPVHAFVDTSTP